MYDNEELDITKFKYVLYARKSTDDPERQIRSTEDQIAECRLMAERLKIQLIEEPIIERKSAKKPHQRPLFTQMLKDIKSGKYDAILAWNPDRLARNMLEGGEIIDLVDQGIIKDLKFVTHHFTSDANGKMLLGMAFVLSKQYSDKLSQDVTRGVRRNLQEGKAPTPKHGYLNEDGIYKPDGNNFNLICTAWQMRSEGISIEEITAYLNKSGYARKIKRDGRLISMTAQTLSDVFRDPFYYGVLVQANQKVDLRELYDFSPTTSEEMYNKIQQFSYRRIKQKKSKSQAFYPLKQMVFCHYCDSNMYGSPSTGKTEKRYFYFRCDNALCKRETRSIRGIVVFNFIYDFLDNGLNFNEEEYNSYYDSLTKISDDKRGKLNVEVHSNQGVLKNIERELKEISLGMIKFTVGTTQWKVAENKVNELSEQKEELESEIAKLEERISSPAVDQLSIDQFLNLSKNAATIVKSANVIVKDQICRIIFSNFSVDEKNVVSYQLKEPFATLMKNSGSSSSRGGESRTPASRSQTANSTAILHPGYVNYT